MTDTKPTIEEQIEWAEVLIKCDSGIAPAVVASLKELQSIKSQPVPVEPDKVLAGAARIENQNPTAYRLARKPNGELVLQAAYQWQQGRDYGHTWRDIQTVEYGNGN